MRFQGAVVNVTDLDRSIQFYCEVLEFSLLSRADQLAAVGASGADPTQAVVLRAFGTSPIDGAGHIGLRAFLLETDSVDQLERIAAALDHRSLLVGRRDHTEWSAVVGRDPDGVAVILVQHHARGGSSKDDWKVLDDFLYGIDR